MNDISSAPFFSIIVLSYNSGATIRDTLDSISRQLFVDYEVLICDDGSSDGSCLISREWMAENPQIKAIPIFSETNQGVVRNVNKGYKAARGKWVKPIAADDLLDQECLLKFSRLHDQSCDVIFSKCLIFGRGEGSVLEWPHRLPLMGANELYNAILRGNTLPAPGSFLKREFLIKIGFADESYKMLDDWPMWVASLKGGAKFGFLDCLLVKYRVSNDSVSAKGKKFIPKLLRDDLVIFFRAERLLLRKPFLAIFSALELFCWIINERAFSSDKNSWRIFKKIFKIISFGSYRTI